MHVSEPAPPQGDTSSFVKTHCATCAAGQTVIYNGGRQATYCLLLREWMTDADGKGMIAACDRYERKDGAS